MCIRKNTGNALHFLVQPSLTAISMCSEINADPQRLVKALAEANANGCGYAEGDELEGGVGYGEHSAVAIVLFRSNAVVSRERLPLTPGGTPKNEARQGTRGGEYGNKEAGES